MDNYITVLDNIDLQTALKKIGFEPIGSGWYENKEQRIKIRLWLNCEIDFWRARYDDNELRFRGQINTFNDVLFVLDRCFDYTPR